MAMIEIKDLERPVEELSAAQMKGIYGGFWWGGWSWNPWSWFNPAQDLKTVSALTTVAPFRW